METKPAMPMVQIELPAVLLKRADLQTVSGARELLTFLLEKYAQELEQSRRRQAYAAYYASRTPEEETEELALLNDFTVADIAITDEEVLCSPIFSKPYLDSPGRGRLERRLEGADRTNPGYGQTTLDDQDQDIVQSVPTLAGTSDSQLVGYVSARRCVAR